MKSMLLGCQLLQEHERSFTQCGDVYFLLKLVQDNKKDMGVVFSCLAIRPIHIYIAHSLEKDCNGQQ